MMSNEYSDIIRNPDILAEDYIPENIPSREPHITELKSSVLPAARKGRPLHTLLYGKSGVGKTSVAKFILSKLKEEAGIEGVYVNCWEHNTLFAVAEKIVYDLRLLRAERTRSIIKLDALLRYMGKKPFILVLDEIDKPVPKDRETILYNLLMLPYVGLICICNSRSFLVNLEDRVRTRLNPRLIEFKPYSHDDLLFILKQRAELGLSPDSWNSSIIGKIAENSQGNARIAIQTMRQASILAESNGSEMINANHVDSVRESVRELEKVYALRNLNEHHRLIYAIINEYREIASGELWKAYLLRCGAGDVRPIARRTFAPYCNRLISEGLVNVEQITEWTQARRFSPVKKPKV